MIERTTNLSNHQSSDDEFSFDKPEVTVNPPKQVDVTLTEESEFEHKSGGNIKDQPLVGISDEELEKEAEIKPPEVKKVAPVEEAKPVPVKKEKIDFVKTMRDNDLELFTKELFTSDIPDEEFSTQLMNDKFLGQQSYVQEIDFNTFEYLPEGAVKHMDELKEDIGRRVATLSPKDKADLAQYKGSDEVIYNKYLTGLDTDFTDVVNLSLAAGALGYVKTKSIVGGLVMGSATMYGLIYGTAEIANSLDRAQRTSPEDLKRMKNTKLNQPFVVPVAEWVEEKLGITPYVSDFIKEGIARDGSEGTVERYGKELAQPILDAGVFKAVGKGLSGILAQGNKYLARSSKLTDDVVESVEDGSFEFSTFMDKLSELLEVQKTIKVKNQQVVAAGKSFDEIEQAYAHLPPPTPSAKNAVVDFDRIAGDAIDKFQASGGKDINAFQEFRINNVRGAKHRLGAKSSKELPKDQAEAQMKAKKSSETWGKGDEGGGTEIMKYVEKYDEVGAMRKKAIKNGDTDLDARLSTIQDDIENRLTIEISRDAKNLQEVQRSMPMRKLMNGLQNERSYNASLLRDQHLTKKARAKLDAKQLKIEKDLKRHQLALKEATSAELATMGIANTIMTNMLGQTAIAKAGFGGFISTTTNHTLLLWKGIHPSQVLKMQQNSFRRLKADFHKFDAAQFKSDAVAGNINSRYKAHNVSKLTVNEGDSLSRKGLKTSNKVNNILSAPVQIGLGTVDYVMDRFNRQARLAEFWLEYVETQKSLGRTSDELFHELKDITDNLTPKKGELNALEKSPEFYKQVMQRAEEGLSTDKMMLSGRHSKNYLISRPARVVDEFINKKGGGIINEGLKYVVPFTRTAASALDAIAENTVLGMFRQVPPNEAFAKLTTRQMQGTVATMGAAYALHDRITVVPKGAERVAGSFGLRTGIRIGDHQYPMSLLGPSGDAIERFTFLTQEIELATADGLDASDASRLMGGLLEVLTVTGLIENVKQFTQDIENFGRGKSKTETTKYLEKYAPAGYIMKGVADLTHGSLAVNPFVAQVYAAIDKYRGNAVSKSSFGTNISEGEIVSAGRGFGWFIERKGAHGTEIELNKAFLDAGVYENGSIAAFRTKHGLVPHSTIMVDGNYTELKLTMAPLTQAVSFGGKRFNVSLATKNNALGVMSLDKEKMLGTLDVELTKLTYLEPKSHEGRVLKKIAIQNMKAIQQSTQVAIGKLRQQGMDKPLPQVLLMLMKKGAPNVTDGFDDQKYAVRNLMRFNEGLFGGDLAKQKEFFAQVNRTKDAILFYNYIKKMGQNFMKFSSESISTEIKRIEDQKER